MSVVIRIEQQNGEFVGRAVHDPSIAAHGRTREEVAGQIRSRLDHLIAAGELLVVEPSTNGLRPFFGAWPDSPEHREMIDDIYRHRSSDATE